MTMYLDNAATSRFKPPSVFAAIEYDLRHSAGSGRSAHKDAINAGVKIELCREYLLSQFNAEGDYNLAFTKNCTEALNLAIFGSIKQGQTVVTSTNEHNSVLRPLFESERKNIISLKVLQASQNNEIRNTDIQNTAKGASLIALGGASNVTGASLDVSAVGEIARQNGARFLLDGAQCVPNIKIDMKNQHIDMLACPGHKGLHGIQGTGFLIFKKDIPLSPLLYGGTGAYSQSKYQPLVAPEGYEAGTLFAGGIAALKAGAAWSFERADSTREKFMKLTNETIYGLERLGCKVYGAPNSFGIVSFNYKDFDSQLIAQKLDDNSVAVRAGLHCAPLTHSMLGTLSQGAVRVSFGVEHTLADVAAFLKIMDRIIKSFSA